MACNTKPIAFAPALKVGEDATTVLLLIVVCAGILVTHAVAEGFIKQNRNLASGRRHCLLARTGGQPAIECSERRIAPPPHHCGCQSVRPARLDDRRVREDITLLPEILLPGARHSQDVKVWRWAMPSDRCRIHRELQGQRWTQPMDLGQINAE